MFRRDAERLTEALEMDDFPGAQKTDRVADFRIFDQTQDVVIRGPRLLFWGDLVKTTYKNTRKNR